MEQHDVSDATEDGRRSPASIDRRAFLGLAGAGLVSVGALAASASRARALAVDRDPFALGVASGDAERDRVVIWTRLAPDPLSPETGFGMGDHTEVAVRWRLAATESHLASASKWLASGQATAVADEGFSVHVDVSGLEPGRRYFYQFEVDAPGGDVHRSPVGRTKTAYAAGDDTTVRFAVVTCQNLARGDGGEFFFNGHDDLGLRNDLDFVVFLGDYIYEFGRAAHQPPRAVTSLDDYRTRYGQYKMRASLQEVHRRFPVYVMPDDHEFWNDYRGGALNTTSDVRRFNRALEALWEHMPLRGGRPGPIGATKNDYRLHRQIAWGSNLDMFLTDVRQHRGPSMLGDAQSAELLTWLRDTTAAWTTIATPTPMWWNGSNSGWNAFTGIRDSVTSILQERTTATPATFNPVVLSGDIHCGIVTHVRREQDQSSPIVATEFINAPMTSQAGAQYVPDTEVRHAYNDVYGYMVCTAEPSGWTARYVVGNETDDPHGTVKGEAPWKLDAGAPPGSVHLEA